MSETLTPQEVIPQTLDQEIAPTQMSGLSVERQHLSLALVDRDLIPREMFESGALDSFALDEETQVDGLKHILVGDESGGGHHLPTLMGLEANNVAVASMIQPQESLIRKLSPGQLRKEQKTRQNGTFKALDVRVTDGEGETYNKLGGTTMFPNEWSTKQVVESILQTSQAPGEIIEDRNATRHIAEINGVNVVVITSNSSGKIITGFPR